MEPEYRFSFLMDNRLNVPHGLPPSPGMRLCLYATGGCANPIGVRLHHPLIQSAATLHYLKISDEPINVLSLLCTAPYLVLPSRSAVLNVGERHQHKPLCSKNIHCSLFLPCRIGRTTRGSGHWMARFLKWYKNLSQAFHHCLPDDGFS